MSVLPAKDLSLQEAERDAMQILDSLASDGITKRELQRIKKVLILVNKREEWHVKNALGQMEIFLSQSRSYSFGNTFSSKGLQLVSRAFESSLCWFISKFEGLGQDVYLQAPCEASQKEGPSHLGQICRICCFLQLCKSINPGVIFLISLQGAKLELVEAIRFNTSMASTLCSYHALNGNWKAVLQDLQQVAHQKFDTKRSHLPRPSFEQAVHRIKYVHP